MTVSWRILSLLALTACLVLPSMKVRTVYAATAQNSAAAPAPSKDNAAAIGATTQSTPLPAPSSEAVQGPAQPIPFSHKEHAGTLKLPCEYCHAPSRSGETLKIPQAAFCMQCHQTMATGDLGVQKLAAFSKSNALIPWVRVYQVPSFVTFSHKTHLAHGVTCQDCHGEVADQVRVYKAMDISMGACIKCHTAKHASIDCNTCHILNQ